MCFASTSSQLAQALGAAGGRWTRMGGRARGAVKTNKKSQGDRRRKITRENDVHLRKLGKQSTCVLLLFKTLT
jgi:hypothetical protein